MTIIIPTFNRPKFFREALESALNQTYRNIEIVISDDSTIDDTEILIQSYNDARIKYFRHKDFNADDNWNFLRAYDNPAAEYVNWLMDDDIFYPTKIEKMVEVYRTNPDVSLVTSSKKIINAEGNIIGNTQKPFEYDLKIPGDKAGRLLFFWDNYIGEPTTVLIRKKFLRDGDLCWNEDETGFFPLIDVSTWCQLLTQGNLVRLIECLSGLRVHKGQCTHSDNTVTLFAICYARLLKTAIDKGVFFRDEKELRRAVLFVIDYSVVQLNKANNNNFHGKEVETLEKTLDALAQALINGYKLELPTER